MAFRALPTSHRYRSGHTAYVSHIPLIQENSRSEELDVDVGEMKS